MKIISPCSPRLPCFPRTTMCMTMFYGFIYLIIPNFFLFFENVVCGSRSVTVSCQIHWMCMGKLVCMWVSFPRHWLENWGCVFAFAIPLAEMLMKVWGKGGIYYLGGVMDSLSVLLIKMDFRNFFFFFRFVWRVSNLHSSGLVFPQFSPCFYWSF